MSIRQTFFAGVRWTSFSAMLSFVLGMVQVALLARLLEKSDFAWVAIAGVFINIGIQLQQAGLNAAIIQQSSLSKVQLSTVYWLNIGFGFLLFILSTVFAYLMGWLYASLILIPIFILYGIVFLIQAFSVQYKALLQKNFHFQTLSIGESIGVIGSFVVSIYLALHGWGAYALVGGYIIKYLAEGIYLIIKGIKHFKPTLEWNWESVQPLLQYGGWHLTERLITHFSSQLDILLIGKLLGSEALGTYDVFKRVLVRPINLLNDVFEKITFPVFSKFQNDHNIQKKLYLNLLAHLGAINFPLLAFVAFAAKPIVLLFFGNEWVLQVPVFQLLCAFCALHFLLNPADTLLLAAGKIRLWLLANLAFVPVQILFLIIGGQFDLTIITWMNVMAYALFTIATYIFIILPQIQSKIFEWIQCLARPSLLTFIAILLLVPFQFFSIKIILLIPMGILFTITYFILTLFYNRDFIQLIKQLLRFKS